MFFRYPRQKPLSLPPPFFCLQHTTQFEILNSHVMSFVMSGRGNVSMIWRHQPGFPKKVVGWFCFTITNLAEWGRGGETKNWPPRRPSVVADQARPEGSIRNYLLSIKKGTTNLVKFSGVFEEPARVGVQFGVFRTKYGVFKRFHWNHFANCAHP